MITFVIGLIVGIILATLVILTKSLEDLKVLLEKVKRTPKKLISKSEGFIIKTDPEELRKEQQKEQEEILYGTKKE